MRKLSKSSLYILFVMLFTTQSFVGPYAHASSWDKILGGTPFERFNENDIKIFVAASRKALNEAADNEMVPWNNPQTGSSGEITVLKTFEANNHQCKLLKVKNTARNQSAVNDVNLCMIEGAWKVVTSSSLK